MTKTVNIYFLFFTVILWSFGLTTYVSAKQAPDTVLIREALDLFCKSDFEGLSDARLGSVNYTDSKLEYADNENGEIENRIVALESDPIVIVDRYEVVNISIYGTGNKGYGDVFYSQLASTVGKGLGWRHFLVDRQDKITRIYLKKTGGNWRVYYPPIPHVSLISLRKYYESRIDSMGEIMKGNNISEAQKRSFNDMLADFDFIMNLQ